MWASASSTTEISPLRKSSSCRTAGAKTTSFMGTSSRAWSIVLQLEVSLAVLVAAGAQVSDQGIYLRLGKAISKGRHYLASESNLSQHL
jgi:hypothetical protein